MTEGAILHNCFAHTTSHTILAAIHTKLKKGDFSEKKILIASSFLHLKPFNNLFFFFRNLERKVIFKISWPGGNFFSKYLYVDQCGFGPHKQIKENYWGSPLEIHRRIQKIQLKSNYCFRGGLL